MRLNDQSTGTHVQLVCDKRLDERGFAHAHLADDVAAGESIRVGQIYRCVRLRVGAHFYCHGLPLPYLLRWRDCSRKTRTERAICTELPDGSERLGGCRGTGCQWSE